MSAAENAVKNLRERLTGAGEDHLGKALSDLLDSPLVTGTIGRAFDAREKAVQAQELALGALNIPSSADIERLTRRLRSVSQRLEGIEDGVHRLDRALAARGVDPAGIGQRLSQIEQQIGTLTRKLDATVPTAKPARSTSATSKPSTTSKPTAPGSAASKTASSKSAPAKRAPAKREQARRTPAKPAKPRARRAPAKPKKQA